MHSPILEEMGKVIVEKALGTREVQVAGEAEVLNIFGLKGGSKSKGPDMRLLDVESLMAASPGSCTMRLLRSGEVVFEGSCASLKREKKDVEAVGKGVNRRLIIQDCDGFQVGDLVECLEQMNRKPKFVSSESGAVCIVC